MEEHLTRALGVRLATRPDGNAREVVGIDQKVMDLFSSRRRAITAKTKTLVAAFEAQFGRAPNSLELDRLQRSATFATRNAKSHQGETVAERLDRWDAELRAEVRGGLAQVAADVLDQAQADQEVPAWSVSDGDRDGAGRRPRDEGGLDRAGPHPGAQQRPARPARPPRRRSRSAVSSTG